jgi:ureidoglycolate dehydrogenase (NAD+)
VFPDDLKAFCVTAMMAGGLGREAANTTADVLVTTDTWGVHTHGTKQIRGLMKNFRDRRMSLSAQPVVVRESAGAVLIDAHQSMPMVASVQAMEMAIEKARQTGTATAVLRNSGHFGGAGYYAYLAAQHDMVGLAFTNVDPGVTVPGACVPLLGTNPLAYAVPAGDEPPIMLDIATSVVAASKIYALRDVGKPIPEGWIIDKDGLPTTDPTGYPSVGAMLPMAGHKGYGIGLMVEILTGVLGGGAFGPEVVSWILETPTPVNQSHSFIAINIEAFQPVAEFKKRMDSLIRFIKNAPRAKGSERIYLPGEMEHEARQQALRMGMTLPDHVMVRLQGLAEDYGLSMDRLYA